MTNSLYKCYNNRMMFVVYRHFLLMEDKNDTLLHIKENYLDKTTKYVKDNSISKIPNNIDNLFITKKEFKIIENCLEEKRKCIDIVEPYLNKWTFDRLPNIDKAILLLAIYHIINKIGSDILIINSSIEIIKRFGELTNYKYINAVLDKIAKSIKKD